MKSNYSQSVKGHIYTLNPLRLDKLMNMFNNLSLTFNPYLFIPIKDITLYIMRRLNLKGVERWKTEAVLVH